MIADSQVLSQATATERATIERLRSHSGWWSGDARALEVLREFKQTTSEDVAAWLIEQTAALRIAEAEIIACTNRYSLGEARFIVSAPPHGQSYSSNFAQAVAGLRNKIKSPEQIATEKRAAAAKLLAEADRLAPA